MAFTEALVRDVRRRAHFQCCLCKTVGVEVHHIVPKAEGGKDTSDNAAPLCPSCHEIYGANRTKRKLIREARALWYEICDRRYAPDASLLQEVHAAVTNAASKTDISLLRDDIAKMVDLANRTHRPKEMKQLGRQGATDQDISIRDILKMVHSSTDRPSGQVEILCLKILWPIKGGFRSVYNDFCQRFGERTLRHLAARAMDEAKVRRRIGLTEHEIKKVLHLMSIDATCMVLLDQGDLSASLRHDGEILWGKPRVAAP